MAAYASQNVVYGTAFLNSLMAAYGTVATGPLVATAKMRLNSNPGFNPQPGDSIATNTANEAAFTGYPAGGIDVVLSTPVNLSPTCQGTVASGTFTATTSGSFVSGTAYGYWIDDGTNVIAAEPFPPGSPALFAGPGDFLELVVQLPAQARQATI